MVNKKASARIVVEVAFVFMIRLELYANYAEAEATVNMVKKEVFVQNARVRKYVSTRLRGEDAFLATAQKFVSTSVSSRGARNVKEMEYVAMIGNDLHVKYVIQRVI